MKTETKHTIIWWALRYDSQENRMMRVRRESWMRDGDFGWDASCSCGWDSLEGGALASYIRKGIDNHKFDADYENWSAKQDARHEATMARHEATMARLDAQFAEVMRTIGEVQN